MIWPWFLPIQGTRNKDFLQKLSLFALHKGIVDLAGEPKSVRKLRSNNLLVEVEKEAHSESLVKISFSSIPVKVSPHFSQNSIWGVICCPERKFCDEEEILRNFSSYHVSRVRKISIQKEGWTIRTGTVILTSTSSTPPSLRLATWMSKWTFSFPTQCIASDARDMNIPTPLGRERSCLSQTQFWRTWKSLQNSNFVCQLFGMPPNNICQELSNLNQGGGNPEN